MHRSRVTLEVKGSRRELEVDHRWALLRTLREELGLTGAKRGVRRYVIRGHAGAEDPVQPPSLVTGDLEGRSVTIAWV